jgi:hypothetical protein
VPQPEIVIFQRSGNGNKIAIVLGLAPVWLLDVILLSVQRMTALADDLAAATVA